MTYAAGHNDLTLRRGDSQTLAFACTASPSAVKFYVRRSVDGAAVLALTLAAQPAQITYTALVLSVAILPADTDGQLAGNHLYDLEVTIAGATTTTHWGRFTLIGDIATDAVSAAVTATTSWVRWLGRAAVAPTGISGAVYYDTALGRLRIYDGAQWVDVTASGSLEVE